MTARARLDALAAQYAESPAFDGDDVRRRLVTMAQASLATLAAWGVGDSVPAADVHREGLAAEADLRAELKAARANHEARLSDPLRAVVECVAAACNGWRRAVEELAALGVDVGGERRS